MKWSAARKTYSAREPSPRKAVTSLGTSIRSSLLLIALTNKFLEFRLDRDSLAGAAPHE